jgi:Tfp pilus assembly protein PilF
MQGQLQWNKVNIPIEPTDRDAGRAAELAEQALTRATDLADRALALDPNCYLAIFVRGLVAGARGQPEAGLVDLYRAHALRPGDTNVLLELCRYSLAAGLDAKWHIDRLLAIDPLSPQSHLMVAMYYGLYGPREQAAPLAHRSLELAPDASLLQVSAAWWIAVAGQPTEAVAILGRARRAAPDDLRGTFASFLECAFTGDADGARRIATFEMERVLSNEYLCLMLAEAYALLDRNDDAVRAMRAAVRLGFINHRHLTGDAPFLDGLRGDPDFQALLAEIQPRWEAVVEWERGQGEELRTLTSLPPSPR